MQSAKSNDKEVSATQGTLNEFNELVFQKLLKLYRNMKWKNQSSSVTSAASAAVLTSLFVFSVAGRPSEAALSPFSYCLNHCWRNQSSQHTLSFFHLIIPIYISLSTPQTPLQLHSHSLSLVCPGSSSYFLPILHNTLVPLSASLFVTLLSFPFPSHSPIPCICLPLSTIVHISSPLSSLLSQYQQEWGRENKIKRIGQFQFISKNTLPWEHRWVLTWHTHTRNHTHTHTHTLPTSAASFCGTVEFKENLAMCCKAF